jgi:hypothetical protein
VATPSPRAAWSGRLPHVGTAASLVGCPQDQTVAAPPRRPGRIPNERALLPPAKVSLGSPRPFVSTHREVRPVRDIPTSAPPTCVAWCSVGIIRLHTAPPSQSTHPTSPRSLRDASTTAYPDWAIVAGRPVPPPRRVPPPNVPRETTPCLVRLASTPAASPHCCSRWSCGDAGVHRLDWPRRWLGAAPADLANASGYAWWLLLWPTMRC